MKPGSIGDLDGDGDPDIVLAKGRHWPQRDLVLLNNGQGDFGERHALGTQEDRTYTAALADLDGDARPDIVVANRGGPDNLSENFICRNDGTGRFPACTSLSSESATTIAAADMDGNGSIDLIVPHRDRGQSYLFLNGGSGQFAAKLPVGPADASTRAVATGDLDGDGRPDLIMGDELQGGAHVYFNLGQGKFSGPVALDAEKDSVYAIAVADLNRDGKPDVVLGNDNTPGIVLVNEGDGRRFTATRLGATDGAVYGLAIGDVTADGCPAIVAARSNARSVLYINACGG